MAIALALISSQNAPAARREHLHREPATDTPHFIAPNTFLNGADEHPIYYVFLHFITIPIRPTPSLQLINLLVPTCIHNAGLHGKPW